MKRKWWHAFVRSGTREFIEEGQRTPDYSLYDLIHGYVYARWPYLYIGIGTGEHRLAKVFGPVFRVITNFLDALNNGHAGIEETARPPASGQRSGTFADGYHGKVVPLSAATRLVTVNEDIQVIDLEKVIPYIKAREIILHNPDHILALECPCRSARQDPCFPLDVCLIVGDPFATFVEQHHPKRSRRITPNQAVEILQAENERGHVHHAFFKDAMLGRFYAICNCCACCCGAMNAHRNGTPMLASSGYVSQVDEDLCIACGDCVEACQFDAITLNDYHAVVSVSDCMGCGVCESVCIQAAHSLVREPSKGEPLEIEALIQEFESSGVR